MSPAGGRPARWLLVAGRRHPPGCAGGEGGIAPLAGQGRRWAGEPLAEPTAVDPAVDDPGPAAACDRPGVADRVHLRPGRSGAPGDRPGPGWGAAGARELGRRRGRWGGGPAPAAEWAAGGTA